MTPTEDIVKVNCKKCDAHLFTADLSRMVFGTVRGHCHGCGEVFSVMMDNIDEYRPKEG